MSFSDNPMIAKFHEDGFCEMSCRFTKEEVGRITDAISDVVKLNPPGLITESNSSVVRGLQGAHLLNPLLSQLARDKRLLAPALELLGGDVYVHQYKVNFKHAFVGEIWPWHQDFTYWQMLDGIPRPNLASAMVALDEITEFNGPLFFIRGSHKFGITQGQISYGKLSEEEVKRGFSAELPFQLTKDEVERMLHGSEIIAPKGPAGTVVFFAANVAHASLPNLTPSSRRLLIITYNRTNNVPVPGTAKRPEHVAGQFFEPLEPVDLFTS